MDRVQTNDLRGPEALQTMAQPNVGVKQTYDSRFGSPAAQQAMQLAQALSGLQPGLQQLSNELSKEQEKDAARFASSLTVEELGKKLADGSMLPSKSPVFVASLQHIYGENYRSQFERDTLAKITSGELNFPDSASLDEYLTNGRNDFLSGKSRYTTAGFDKQYSLFRQKALDAQEIRTSKLMTEQAVNEATQSLITAFTDSAGKPPEERLNGVMAAFDDAKGLGLLKTPEQRKAALASLATEMSSSGDKALVESFLKTQVDNGLTVGTVLGASASTAIKAKVEASFDKSERERVDTELLPFRDGASNGTLNTEELSKFYAANSKYINSATYQSLINQSESVKQRAAAAASKAAMAVYAENALKSVNRGADAAIASGGGLGLRDVQVPTATGGTKTITAEDQRQDAFQRHIDNNKLPFEQALQLAQLNGVKYKPWITMMAGGSQNISSVGYTYVDGKKQITGQLNDQAKQAIEMFRIARQGNQSWTKDNLPSSAYERLDKLAFLTGPAGGMDANQAAAVVNEAERGNIRPSDYDKLKELTVHGTKDLVASSIGDWLTLNWGASDLNATSIRANIRTRSELLLLSGLASNADDAVKQTIKYYEDTFVKVGGAIYSRADLPQVTQGEDVGEWMERYVADKAKSMNLSTDDIVLVPNTTGQFTMRHRGGPVVAIDGQTVVTTRTEIGQWIESQRQTKIEASAQDRNYTNYVKRLTEEQRELQKENPYLIEQFNSKAGGPLMGNTAYSRLFSKKLFTAYEALGKDRLSLRELMEMELSGKQ